jgi:hypothetical protein
MVQFLCFNSGSTIVSALLCVTENMLLHFRCTVPPVHHQKYAPAFSVYRTSCTSPKICSCIFGVPYLLYIIENMLLHFRCTVPPVHHQKYAPAFSVYRTSCTSSKICSCIFGVPYLLYIKKKPTSWVGKRGGNAF